MHDLRISDVAARSGFSTATLRYYERIGLLAPAARTASGYRVYDERTVARLAFIGRAKQLGLSLDDAGELARLWDQDECAAVQGRMTEFVVNKLDETTARIAELQTLATQLSGVASRLADEESRAGPCDENCACNDLVDAASGPDSGANRTSLGENEPPIACTLNTSDMAPRMAQWRALLAQALDQSPIEGGRRVRFAYDQALATQLAGLVVSEQACCAFLGFTLQIAHDRIVLEVTAPEAATVLLDALMGTP